MAGRKILDCSRFSVAPPLKMSLGRSWGARVKTIMSASARGFQQKGVRDQNDTAQIGDVVSLPLGTWSATGRRNKSPCCRIPLAATLKIVAEGSWELRFNTDMEKRARGPQYQGDPSPELLSLIWGCRLLLRRCLNSTAKSHLTHSLRGLRDQVGAPAGCLHPSQPTLILPAPFLFGLALGACARYRFGHIQLGSFPTAGLSEKGLAPGTAPSRSICVRIGTICHTRDLHRRALRSKAAWTACASPVVVAGFLP